LEGQWEARRAKFYTVETWLRLFGHAETVARMAGVRFPEMGEVSPSAASIVVIWARNSSTPSARNARTRKCVIGVSNSTVPFARSTISHRP
jgi:hypothetical protein